MTAWWPRASTRARARTRSRTASVFALVAALSIVTGARHAAASPPADAAQVAQTTQGTATPPGDAPPAWSTTAPVENPPAATTPPAPATSTKPTTPAPPADASPSKTAPAAGASVAVDSVKSPHSSVPKTRWYGWQIIPIDATALGVIAVELALGEDAVPALGLIALGAYAVGGPIVHLVHDRPMAALGSFGLRVGMPAVGALLGSAGENCKDDKCTGGWPTVLGGLVGALTAMSLDVTLLAHVPISMTAVSSSRESIGCVVFGHF